VGDGDGDGDEVGTSPGAQVSSGANGEPSAGAGARRSDPSRPSQRSMNASLAASQVG
jgi:hypothetical protein